MSRTFVNFAVLSIALAISAGALALSANGQPAEAPNARIERLEGAVLAPCCYTEPVSIHQSEIALKMRHRNRQMGWRRQKRPRNSGHVCRSLRGQGAGGSAHQTRMVGTLDSVAHGDFRDGLRFLAFAALASQDSPG